MLVEVKQSERTRHEPQVSMQETSEIVAWIRKNHIVLLSQDGQEVYLSAISFSREYRRYIDGARLDLPSTKFMQLQPYGPWNITDAGHVKHLAGIIVAMTAKYGA
ncbi:hypothetical protein ASPVEDRAFT_82816 [Aspergillus versicolor CBS 583.65]|uniref:Uncharacterized protein n=1 Tax=Aspergillus versicolor CBS 583.65 TaxID=1036611 RepID=A0A1L9PIG9_ASPVE|nr:uncharacterized protein ASPVEDRAFT_82816 [Aspergillus versicolor CBS 583.65]OJJ01291.1 hypothetical protein ASPVEDRAFT_82816 [Aspergillus versicolor CBS 583.65]